MTTQKDIDKGALKLKAIAEGVMAAITAMPPEVQARCVKPSARLVDLLVRLDRLMGSDSGERG